MFLPLWIGFNSMRVTEPKEVRGFSKASSFPTTTRTDFPAGGAPAAVQGPPQLRRPPVPDIFEIVLREAVVFEPHLLPTMAAEEEKER